MVASRRTSCHVSIATNIFLATWHLLNLFGEPIWWAYVGILFFSFVSRTSSEPFQFWAAGRPRQEFTVKVTLFSATLHHFTSGAQDPWVQRSGVVSVTASGEYMDHQDLYQRLFVGIRLFASSVTPCFASSMDQLNISIAPVAAVIQLTTSSSKDSRESTWIRRYRFNVRGVVVMQWLLKNQKTAEPQATKQLPQLQEVAVHLLPVTLPLDITWATWCFGKIQRLQGILFCASAFAFNKKRQASHDSHEIEDVAERNALAANNGQHICSPSPFRCWKKRRF